MNLRSLAKKSLVPLVLACGMAPSCSENQNHIDRGEPQILGPIEIIGERTFSQEQIIEDNYQVEIKGEFSSEVLNAIEKTLEQIESTYPSLLPQLNLRIRGTPQIDILSPGSLGFAAPGDLIESLRALEINEKLTDIEERMLNGEKISQEEGVNVYNLKNEFDGLDSNVPTITIPTNIPVEGLRNKGLFIEEVIGHEIGHIVHDHIVHENPQLYSELKEEYDRISPSIRNEIVSEQLDKNSDEAEKLYNLVSLIDQTEKYNRMKHFDREILEEGFISNHPRLADYLIATKDIFENRIENTSGAEKDLLIEQSVRLGNSSYSEEKAFYSEDFASFFAYTVFPRDLPGDFPLVDAKAEFMKKEVKKAYKLK